MLESDLPLKNSGRRDERPARPESSRGAAIQLLDRPAGRQPWVAAGVRPPAPHGDAYRVWKLDLRQFGDRRQRVFHVLRRNLTDPTRRLLPRR
jgi:hypothetical protein